MGVFNRFFGTRESNDQDDALVALPTKEDTPALQVLFATTFTFDPAAITSAMREFHPSMAKARCEVVEELNEEGQFIGLAGWDDHVIQFVGFNLPMPAESVEACVAPSHYPEDLKNQARAHRAHLMLWYVGRETSVVEQFVALAAFAGVLHGFGANVTMNEAAHTSFPAAALSAQETEEDIMEQLRSFPLPLLYCGFVKYNAPDSTQVWMRTYGAHILGLPDLAAYTDGHDEGGYYFEVFSNILDYMLETGNRLAAGDTMQVSPDDYMSCRAPETDEEWLESKGEILVVEMMQGDDE